MTVLSVRVAAGRRRSPATLPGYHAGRPPRNKGMRSPPDPPTVEEIVAVMRHTPDNRHGWRLRAVIVVLWRAGLRYPGSTCARRARSTSGADRCWFATAREGADARSAWTSGAGSSYGHG